MKNNFDIEVILVEQPKQVDFDSYEEVTEYFGEDSLEAEFAKTFFEKE